MFIGWIAGARLGKDARAQIADGSNLVAVSAASVWEASIKRSIGKMTLDFELESAIDAAGFVELPIQSKHATRVGDLPWHHKDPFDRMLIAQASLEGLTIVTRDVTFDEYEVDVLKA